MNEKTSGNRRIGVCVTFSLGDSFDEQAIRRIAGVARAKFEGMPGLRSKTFTLNPAKREAMNFYVWDSREAAMAVLSDSQVDRIAVLYGVRPVVEFLEIAERVDNSDAGLIP